MYIVLADSEHAKHCEKFDSMDSALAHWQSVVDAGHYDSVSLTHRKSTKRTIISRDQDGEYRVKLFIDGVYQENCDYFTDDKEDARLTADLLRKSDT